MSTVGQFRDEVTSTHQRFLDAVEPLGDAALENEPACGTWPVREVAGHLAAWNLLILAWARALLDGTQADLQPIRDFDGFNAESAVRTSHMSWAAVKAELDATIASAEQFISGLTDDQLALPANCPWGRPSTLHGLLRGIDEHEEEHLHELLVWLEGRTTPA
ncbi:MAG TPA: DinB family protein [Thermomicrobiales bacterium]|nr:DinB family protein [Thermomicrobiales bacterium]